MKYEMYLLEGESFKVKQNKYQCTVLPRVNTVLVKIIDDKQNYSEKKYDFADLQEIYTLIDEVAGDSLKRSARPTSRMRLAYGLWCGL